MATQNPQTSRPAVSVVVPFRGDWAGADRLVAALRCLDIRDGDELIVAVNTGCGNAGRITAGIVSGGDRGSCRRRSAGGWRLDFRQGAVVHHRHRATLPSLLGAVARYGAGAHWLNERHPGSSPAWPLRYGLAGTARDI